MSFTQNFSITANITTPSAFSLSDTSVGSDGAITGRYVYVQTNDGSYLTPTGNSGNGINWTLASGAAITIDCMDKDYALNITVFWIGGSTILYQKTILAEFNAYARTYRAKLFKSIATNPKQLDNANFFNVYSNITTYINGANEAVTLMSDITLAQLGNNKAKFYIDNPQLAF
jgi:hypothetical protein